MARIRINKTSFASGEVSPSLLGRADLNAYANGARRLRNVYVHPTGGLSRRPGLRFVSSAPGPGRLIAFEFNTEQVYLLLFTDHLVEVFKQGVKIADFPTIWSFDQLAQIGWTQSADTLLVVHQDSPPKRITRTSEEDWNISEWTFFVQDSGRIEQPHHKFAFEDTTLQASGTTGTISIVASGPVFHSQHVNTRFRIENKEVEIVDVTNAGGNDQDGWFDKATAIVKEALNGTTATKDWSEQAFSGVRGFPVSVTFHQDRLIIGGSRELPDRLWLSKSADLFNFDLGEGLDDEAISFAILSDQVNAVRGLFSGRHLQVFTSGAEWMVTGDPLTPTNIQLHRQTRIGSPVDKNVPPRDVDGATIFVPRNGNQIREFLFADIEQAYQATDLSLLSQHIVVSPIDMDYDSRQRILYVVMSDGRLGTLTIYRTEQITAWTVQETEGLFHSVSVSGDEVYVVVERDKNFFVEVFDPLMNTDSGLRGTDDLAKQRWIGIDHLEGKTVKVVADGSVHSDRTVEGGGIDLDNAANSVEVGLGYAHVVEPLPPKTLGVSSVQGTKVRPIAITFRFENTYALQLDTGRGLKDIPFQRFGSTVLDQTPTGYTGEKTVRAFGWIQEGEQPMWRIQQENPLPFHLLSVSTEISVNS